MKIVSCHIENFGGLSKTDISFDKGMNIILRENGWGKSTLAAFIKAMFYGLPVTTKRSLFENERKRLTPWNGGIFGGSMVFEAGDGLYRVERFFGAKESEDTFKLFDEKTKLESKTYTEKLGVELTGLDAESFEKTVFIPQKSIEIEMTDSISAKLSDLLESSDDINNFENAMKNLADSRRNYALLKGKGGRIYENENMLHDVTADIEACEAAIDSLAITEKQLVDVQESIKEQKKELADFEKCLAEADEYALKKVNQDRYFSLRNKIELSKKRLEGIKDYFAESIPKVEEIEENREKITVIAQLDAKISALKNSADEANINEISQSFFKGKVPSSETVEDMISACGKLNELGLKAAEEELIFRQKQVKNRNTGRMMIISGIILAAVTAAAAVWNLAFLIAAAAGICEIAIGLSIKSKKAVCSGDAAKNLSALQEKIDSFLSSYEISGDRTSAVYEIKEKLTILMRLQKERECSALKAEANEKERAELEYQVKSFLAKYKMTELYEDYASALDKLSQNRTKFIDEYERQRELQAELTQFSESQNEEELLKPLTEPKEESDIIKMALKNVKDELEAKARSIMLLNNRKDELEAKAESYSELLREKESLENKIAEEKTKVKIIDKTAELLEKARANLSTRYLDKMTEGFGKYAAEICEINDFDISAKLDLSFKREGKSRSVDFFSTGYRALAGFCMRLSLSDALYSGEQPFLMLDDPFVNLDDEKYERAKALLQRLSADRQIIYFVCRKE